LASGHPPPPAAKQLRTALVGEAANHKGIVSGDELALRLVGRIERKELAADICRTAEKPEPLPELPAWSVYKIAKKLCGSVLSRRPTGPPPSRRPRRNSRCRLADCWW
jgi:hypothetical protein